MGTEGGAGQSSACAEYATTQCTSTGSVQGQGGNRFYPGAAGSIPTATFTVPASPTVTAAGPSTATIGTLIATSSISAQLSSGSSPTGTITFTVFGPQSSAPTTCTAGGSTVGSAVSVSGNGTYHPSVGYTPSAAGDYWWYASYGGDSGNSAAASTCGSGMSETVVGVVTPTLSVAGPGTATIGTAIATSSISAQLSSGSSPTGTITFTVFGPQSSAPTTCTAGGSTVGSAVSVSGNGTYHPSVGYTPSAAGDYWWYAFYGGDSGNGTAASTCGSGMSETVVGRVSPTLSIAVPASGFVSTAISASSITATLSGSSGSNDTNTITFTVFGPQSSAPTSCTSGGTVVGTATPAGDGTYASSTSFSPSATGDYWWYASSPSDANNNATATACPPAAETVVSLLVHNGATLTDAATDAGSGVASVSYYYCPSPNFTVLTCTSSSPWTFVGASSNTSPYPVTWAGQPTNGDYVVVAVGTDNVMNTDTTPSGSIPVTVSNFAPSVAVTYPTSTTYAGNWSGTITGSASSNDGPGTTITSTAVQIEDTTTSQYWNGSGWQSGAVFNAASGGTSWSYGLSAANLTSGHSYSVTGRAVDSVGNSGTSSTVNFTFYVAPAITTSAATNVSTTTATANGSVNPQGDTDTVQFCYSATVSAVTSSSCGGTLVAASTSPASGSSAVSESAALSGLTPGTKYYYDLVVTSSGGTVYYGATVQNFTVHAAPTVTTGAASSVSTTTATLNGTVNAQSDTDTVSFCYSTIQSQVTTCGAGSTVVVASPATASGSSSTSETAALTGLTAGTTYYYNLEAISSGGTAYFGTSTSFSAHGAPAITTSAATNVSTTTATANGSVNPQGDTDTVQFCYSATVSAVTSSSCGGTLVAASTSPASGSSAVSESAALSGLTPGTKYYYDLVVTSSGGTVYYGATVQNFTVHAAPTVTTGAASSVSTTTATLNGTVNAQSDTDTVSFCYSTIQSQVTTCGAGSTVVVASPATASGSSSTSETAALTGLTAGTTYYYNLEAISSGGTAYFGTSTSFSAHGAPAITTSAATNVSTTTATANGSVNPQGDTDTVQFCYSATVSAVTSSSCGGTLVAASTSPASGSSAVSESAALSGLTPGTKYYYDLVVTSSGGTVYYGATVQNFTVHAAPTVTTGAASSVSTTTATLNGTVNAQSDTDTVSFCYSTIQSQVTTCGAGSTVVVASPATASGSSSTSETAALTGLTAGTTYYYNLEAISSGGTAYFGTSTSLTTIAASGAGTMTVSPTSVTSGSTTNQLVFSFTNNSAGAFASNSEITVQVPSGWTAPTSTNTTVSGGTGCTAGSPTFSGLGPWTITVPLASGCGAGDGFSLNYGITGHTVTVPSSTIGTAVFTTDTEEAGGSLVAVGSSPSVTLTTSFATCGTSTVTLLPNSTVNYTLVGGGGGSGANNSGSGGAGAAVTGTLDNTSASSSVTLSVNVGCVGGNGGTSGGSPGGTAYANGGSGGNGNGGSNRGGGAGGGTTSIQITSGTPAYIVVAGGGGGGGGGSAGANGSTSTSTSSSVTTNAGNAGINGSGSNGYGGGGGGGGTGTLDGAGGAAGNNGSTPAGGGGGGDSYSAGTITDGVTVTAGTPTAGSNPGASGSASL